MPVGVLVVDPVHLGAFEQGIRTDLQGAQGGGGIGGEIGVAGSASEEQHMPGLHQGQGVVPREGLGQRTLLPGTEDLGPQAFGPQVIAQDGCVHHRTEHAHVVCGYAVDDLKVCRAGTEDVPGTDHDPHLDSLLHDLGQGLGHTGQFPVAVLLAAGHQGFAAQFQEDTRELHWSATFPCGILPQGVRNPSLIRRSR